MELVAHVKNYEWGKVGLKSEVAQLAQENSEQFKLEPNNTYAELWMGDHVSGASTVKTSGKKLGQVISQPLPFLFKVLSIDKALSIQVHPDKAEATKLHSERPDLYKDPNHKPELAIALTTFTGLCGFRPYNEIHELCMDLPPLKELLGGADAVNELLGKTNIGLRHCFETLMRSPEEKVHECITDISKNYTDVLTKHHLANTYYVISRSYPKDVGILSVFFLNLIVLEPGQSMFLPANEIHAYISGDCIECMACSDNVIRAGLTPKFKDVDLLLSILNYNGTSAKEKKFQPHNIDHFLKMYIPPVEDFAVAQIVVPAKEETYKMAIRPTPAILLVLKGRRCLRIADKPDLPLKRGSIIYIPPEAAPEIEFLQIKGDENEFVAYMAMKNTTERL